MYTEYTFTEENAQFIMYVYNFIELMYIQYFMQVFSLNIKNYLLRHM